MPLSIREVRYQSGKEGGSYQQRYHAVGACGAVGDRGGDPRKPIDGKEKEGDKQEVHY